MKKSLIFRAGIFITVVLVVIGCLSRCAKDPDMVVTIFVKLKNDTNIVVSDARVVLSKEDVEVVGYTDANGKFVHTFKLKMMLDVEATKDTLFGRTTLRLNEPGKRYRKTVFVY
jgi:hypothetical protein